MGKPKLEVTSTEIDMTPMIDMVFLLIIFFILAGKISSEQRTQQITVPPTKTAIKLKADTDRIVINVFGSTTVGGPPANSIRVGNQTFQAKGIEDFSAYARLRDLLDRAYDRAEKKPDLKNPGLMIPEVVLEIRADADTEYRVVQEVLQVVTDSVEPNDAMKPNTVPMAQMKPFIEINYTTRKPGENK